MPKSILITGGARSGKSRFAQELAEKSGGPVLFVATAAPGDEEMRLRIAEHRRSRPATWNTLEATTQLGPRISEKLKGSETVIIDCITLLVSNIFMEHSPDSQNFDVPFLEKEVMAEINGLIDCIKHSRASFIIVTNEVGLGLVPDNEMGRIYRDILGKANQALAQNADEVYLLVSGLPLRLKPAKRY